MIRKHISSLGASAIGAAKHVLSKSRSRFGDFRSLSLGALLIVLQAVSAIGQQSNQALAPITVTGILPVPTKDQLSSDAAADPATVTVVNLSPAEKPNIQSYGDILRPVTGVTIDQYGQGGVGYGVALRGFEADNHGNDVASFVDGVPINQVGSFDAEGYTDLNFLIPQLVGKVEVARGPFRRQSGRFCSWRFNLLHDRRPTSARALYVRR